MKIELTRFHVKRGKSEQVDRWMKMLNDRQPEALKTLKREKMYLEVIFREKKGKKDFLYWFTVQGERGKPVSTSPYKIDKEHVEFGKKCIDIKRGKKELFPEIVLIPKRISVLMNQREKKT